MKKFNLFLLILLLPVFVQGALVNINTAGVGELKTLTGVGDVIAGRIVEYRSANGLFKTIEELKNVKGIGDATFAKMKANITIGGGVTVPSDNTPNPVPEDDFSDEAEDMDSDNSAHTSPSPLSNYLAALPKIGAGRERLATVKTAIEFVAYDNKKLTEGDQVTYVWSFGDGTSAMGPKVSHAYNFAGTYNVVLNVNYNNKESAVARTKVSVLESTVFLGVVNREQNYLEIINTGPREQNINGWFLANEVTKYYLPLDTIIRPKSKIKIPLWFLGQLSSSTIALYYPNGEVVGGEASTRAEELAVLQNKLMELKSELALKQSASLASSAKLQNDKLTNNNSKSVILNKKQSFLTRWRELIF